MIKELYQENIKELSINLTSSNIDSIMKKNIVKSGCRVYENGSIGIAGTFGEPTEDTWQEAIDNLKAEIPYPYDIEVGKVEERDLRDHSVSEETFLQEVEIFTKELHEACPDFILSNKIIYVESRISLENNKGLSYVNYDSSVQVELIVKHKDSKDIIDTAIVKNERGFNKEELLREAKEMLTQFMIPVELPKEEKIPVIVLNGELPLLTIFTDSLNGEVVGLKTSIFSDKVGESLFHPDFTLYQDTTKEKIHVPFFDTEGVVNNNGTYTLIREGVIKHVFTDKKTAHKFSYPCSGAAGGEYDEVPNLSGVPLSIATGDENLKEMLNGSLGALVVLASGGGYSADGKFASPIQMAYLTDGEKILGKLPEFTISGNVYDMFGEDFMGVSVDKPFFADRGLVIRMKVEN